VPATFYVVRRKPRHIARPLLITRRPDRSLGEGWSPITHHFW
jgi:hypothetical protein